MVSVRKIAGVAKLGLKAAPKKPNALFDKVKQPVVKRYPSPVPGLLMFRKPVVAESLPETPAQIERAQAKAAKRHDEDMLWAAYFKGRSEEARNALWVYYQPLVRYVSERLKTKLPEMIDLYDLIGSGNVGLQYAIAKFEPAVGVRFETYCVPRIRGSILDSIRALDWVPRLIRNKGHQYQRVVREMAARLHREPTDEEIRERLKMDMQEFQDLRSELNVKAQISVEGCKSENSDQRDTLRLEMLDHDEEVDPTRDLQREEIRTMALRGLSQKERQVVDQYYFHGRSMKQIGDEMSLSESRICQIHAQVLAVLRKKFKAYEDSCYL